MAIADRTNREQIAIIAKNALTYNVNGNQFENFLTTHPKLSL